MAIPTQQNILDALQQNETNLCAWSKDHEYKYTTVFNTVLRWAGRDDRTPHGGLARQIMSDLAVYVEEHKVRHPDEQVANFSGELDTLVRHS